MPKPPQSTYLGWPQNGQLDHAMMIVCRAFEEDAWHVGSSTKGVEYRDVDVRIIMDDAKFTALFGDWNATRWQPFWSLVCTSISLYLRQVTDLPVDFQIQRRSDVKGADWDESRTGCGHYPNIDAVKPPWLMAKNPQD